MWIHGTNNGNYNTFILWDSFYKHQIDSFIGSSDSVDSFCEEMVKMITPEEFELYEALGLDIDELLKFDREVENSIILLNYIKGEI